MPILVHFLLVYDHAIGQLREELKFTNAEEAIAAYAAMEERHRHEARVEIVLVGADSIGTVRQTHGHYFDAQQPGFTPLPIGEPLPVASAH